MFSEADSFLISVIYRSKQQKKPYSQRPGAEEKSATIQSPKTVRPYAKSTVIPQLKVVESVAGPESLPIITRK